MMVLHLPMSEHIDDLKMILISKERSTATLESCVMVNDGWKLVDFSPPRGRSELAGRAERVVFCSTAFGWVLTEYLPDNHTRPGDRAYCGNPHPTSQQTMQARHLIGGFSKPLRYPVAGRNYA